MPHLYLPTEHTDADLVLAADVAAAVVQCGPLRHLDDRSRHRHPRGRGRGARRAPRSGDEPLRRPADRALPGRRRALALADRPAGAAHRHRAGRRRDARSAQPQRRAGGLGRAVAGAVRAAPAPAVGSSPSGGLAPSRAHGSSNSTRHLPSSVCISASRARKERPERPLKPATGALRAARGDQLARHRGGQRLAGLGLPDHEAAARVLARPAREALAVLDDVVAADRARPEVRARDAHVLELLVERRARSRRRTARCRA